MRLMAQIICLLFFVTYADSGRLLGVYPAPAKNGILVNEIVPGSAATQVIDSKHSRVLSISP